MPGILFEPPEFTRPRTPRHRGTLTASIVLHTLALAGLVAWQLHAAAGTPAVAARLHVVTLPAPPPLPPPAPRSAEPVRADAATMPDPASAPVAPPDTIGPAPDARPGTPVSNVVVASPGGSPGALSGATSVSLSAGVPPAPPAPPPVRVHSGVRPPRQLIQTRPDYPPTARAARVEGTVILEATIDETGAVRDLKVLRSIPLLDRAAIEAVSRWRYEPTRLNGQPVAIVMTVTVTFTLK